MQNFQAIILIWIKAYKEVFKSAFNGFNGFIEANKSLF